MPPPTQIYFQAHNAGLQDPWGSVNQAYTARNKHCILKGTAQDYHAIKPIATAWQSEKLQEKDKKWQNTVFKLDYAPFSPLISLQCMFQVKVSIKTSNLYLEQFSQ